jgi:hypothetical protein
MVWLVEKKVFYHIIDLGFESIEIPVRVKFECEIEEGQLVSGSMSKSILYNRQALERRYPNLDIASLQRSIEHKIDREIHKYLKACGYVEEKSGTVP